MTKPKPIGLVDKLRARKHKKSDELKIHDPADGAKPTDDGRGMGDTEEEFAVPWPTLNRDALHGLAGEIVDFVNPATEADPVAVVSQFLISFGNVVGRKPHYMVSETRHGLNEFGLIIGNSAKARKGTSWDIVRKLIGGADLKWRIKNGLSSGQGLLDVAPDKNPNDPDSEGVKDKRLLICETEFATVLAQMGKEGNILSTILREAWDGTTLSNLNRKETARTVTDPHFSVIGHTTIDELKYRLSSNDKANGFFNRFVPFLVRRTKQLPHPVPLSRDEMREMQGRIKKAVGVARRIGQIKWDAQTYDLWTHVYNRMSAEKPGLIGTLTARSDAHTIRFACIYAALDGSDKIREAHLRAADALVTYSQQSAEFIFAQSFGDRYTNSLAAKLKAALPGGLTMSELNSSRNKTSDEFRKAVDRLVSSGFAALSVKTTNGRDAQICKWIGLV